VNINAIDLLDWLANEGRPSPATVADCLRIGIPDLTELEAPDAATALFAKEAQALRENLPENAPISFTNFAETLCKVGHRVFVEEPENTADWLVVVDRATARPHDWDASRGMDRYHEREISQKPYLDSWHRRSGPVIIRQFLDAGRGPSYAREMIDRALASRVAPDMFGYSARITPPLFTELVEAGIRTADTLWAFEQAGCTIPEAIAMATDGIDGGAAWAAAISGIPRNEWFARLRGLPSSWFKIDSGHGGTEKNTLENGILGEGFTWEDVAELHANGWGKEFSPYGISYEFRGTQPDFFRRASRVTTIKELKAYREALESGSGNERCGMPPLTFGRTWDQTLDLVAQLKGAGVAPSGLGPYRAAGCRTVDEVLEAVRLGITAPIAKQLVKSHGIQADKWSPKRIGSFRNLVRAHEEHATV
jgi:hypothetical protein